MRATFFLLILALVVACDGTIGEAAPATVGPEAGPYQPGAGRLRRLTAEQYRGAIEDVIGPLAGEDLVLPASLEPDRRELGLIAIGQGSGSVSPRGVEQYEDGAYLIAEQLVATWPTCAEGEVVNDVCASESLRTLGRRLWRRPLTSEELEGLVRVSRLAAEELGEFRAGLAYGVASLLQSPNFLFRSESGEQVGGERRLTRWELATRLSYFLWNRGPSDMLLDAASRGELDDPARFAEFVRAMLDDARSTQGVRRIFSDMFELDRLDGLQKDRSTFVHMSPEVGPAAREETLRLVEWLYTSEADYRELFTTRTTFIDRKLASIYGVQAPSREGFARFVHEPSSERSGILGHISTLALHSHVAASSATLRGIFVRRTLLCGEIPPPPADVDTSIPEPRPGSQTLRARVSRHLEDPSCATCHRLMDPLGLGLENFDALGIFRQFDSGARIDASGNVDGAAFRTPTEFGAALAASPEAMRCAAATFYRVAHGRRESEAEARAIDEITASFEEGGFRIRTLMEAVALHPSFRLIAEEDSP